MTTIGFYCFTTPEVVVELTLKEKIALISSADKVKILDAYIQRIPAAHLDHKLGIAKELIEDIYQTISDLQEYARSSMRGEIEVTPAVIDPDTGEITTPAVMNIPPATQGALVTEVEPLFTDFTSPQVGAIVSAMVKWSKYDGIGTFTFYKSQIIL